MIKMKDIPWKHIGLFAGGVHFGTVVEDGECTAVVENTAGVLSNRLYACVFI